MNTMHCLNMCRGICLMFSQRSSMDLSYPITYLKEYPHQRTESREKWTIDVKKIYNLKMISKTHSASVSGTCECVCWLTFCPHGRWWMGTSWLLETGHDEVEPHGRVVPWPCVVFSCLSKFETFSSEGASYINLHSMLCFARLHKLQAKPNGQQIVKPIRLSPAWVGNCFPLRVLAKRFCMTLNWQLEQVHTSETIIKTGIMCSHLVVHSNPSMILAAGRVSNTEHHSCRSLMDKLDLNTGDIRKGMELPGYKRCRIH